MSGTHTDITERKLLEQSSAGTAVVFDSSYRGSLSSPPICASTKSTPLPVSQVTPRLKRWGKP